MTKYGTYILNTNLSPWYVYVYAILRNKTYKPTLLILYYSR